MRKIRFIIPLLLILCLVGCADLQKVWDKATPQERCRIIAFKMQRSLDGAFDAGKLYVASHPEKAVEWKAKAIPTFDFANKTLRTFISKDFAGMTYEQVILEIQPKINDIIALLATWGVIVSE